MREVICPVTVVSNTEQLSDQFSIVENTNEVLLTFKYVKDTEAGIEITIERNDIADANWGTLSDTTAIGVNPLTPWTLEMTASDVLTYSLKSYPYGFYRVRFKAKDAVAKNGNLTIYVTRDR